MRELMGDQRRRNSSHVHGNAPIGVQNTEPVNWDTSVGNLSLHTGRLEQAELLYQTSLKLYPDYLHALAGMGKVRVLARGDYDGAIEYYKKALNQIPIPEYVIALGDVYTAAGNKAEAQKQYALVELFASCIKRTALIPIWKSRSLTLTTASRLTKR